MECVQYKHPHCHELKASYEQEATTHAVSGFDCVIHGCPQNIASLPEPPSANANHGPGKHNCQPQDVATQIRQALLLTAM